MPLYAKFQKDSFIKSIVSSKNIKRIFLLSELFHDGFSKTLFYDDIVNNGTWLSVEFHGCQPSSLMKTSVTKKTTGVDA